MKFLPISENGENGLGDEGADGGNAPPLPPPSPRIFGLEPPLPTSMHSVNRARHIQHHKIDVTCTRRCAVQLIINIMNTTPAQTSVYIYIGCAADGTDRL